MQFWRIDEGIFQCIVTMDDLQLFGGTFNTIIGDGEKMTLLVSEILQEAKQQIDFSVDVTRVLVYLQLLDDTTAILTIIDCENEVAEQFLPMFNHDSSEITNYNACQFANQDCTLESEIIFRFKSFKSLEGYAKAYPFDIDVDSNVFKDEANGAYYLCFDVGSMNPEEVYKIRSFTIEFAEQCDGWNGFHKYCDEHFKCLIKSNALAKLAEFAV